MTLQELSPNAQDYLKVIWGLMEWGQQTIQPSELAKRANVKPSTVSGAVARLVSGGYARHDPYGAIELTKQGERYAVAMVRKHRLLETFLVTTLNYAWDEVHTEADMLEHAASDTMIDRIDQLLGHPATDPHGDPIPRADGTLPDVPITALCELADGDHAVIARVSDANPDVLRDLDHHGIGIGTTVVVSRDDESSDDVRITAVTPPPARTPVESAAVTSAPISLNKNASSHIRVNVTNSR
jgi:DtxR family Mn-dependent transcriptional regulator